MALSFVLFATIAFSNLNYIKKTLKVSIINLRLKNIKYKMYEEEIKVGIYNRHENLYNITQSMLNTNGQPSDDDKSENKVPLKLTKAEHIILELSKNFYADLKSKHDIEYYFKKFGVKDSDDDFDKNYRNSANPINIKEFEMKSS